MRELMTDCCEEFEKAQENCTDNEGHHPAITLCDYKYKIGCGLKPINFCSWCGKSLWKEEVVDAERK